MSLQSATPGRAGGWRLLALSITVAASISALAVTRPRQSPSDEISAAQRGVQRMMDGDFNGAVAIFRRIQQEDSESPLGYVLEADADWWQIYLTQGNLIDPDVFEALSESATPYDADFERLENLAISKAEARIQAKRDEAPSYLYEGLAYALQARLDALRDHALATARSGKKMRSLSLKAISLDPKLYDADLGIGIYNYFEDTLPGYVKLLRFLIRLPKGDRELGLRQLQEAADKGELTRGEAQFHLAKNLSRRLEHQYARSLGLLEQMTREYPHNPLWRLLVASLEIRLGRTAEGEEGYQEVIKSSAGMPPVWRELHEQAGDALARRHPQYRR